MNDLKKPCRWKIQLTITINFICSKDDNDEERVMRSKGGNMKIMISDDADEVIQKIFDSIKSKYENKLLIFDYVPLSHYKCHKKI